MHIKQRDCQKINEVNTFYIQKTLQGKRIQLSPRTFIVKADGRYLAVAFNCFERLAAAFLKIVHVDYFKWRLKAKEFKILTPGDLKAALERPIPPQKPAPEIPIQKVQPPLPDAPIPNQGQPANLLPVQQPPVQQKRDEPPAGYDLERAFEQVRTQAATIAGLNKKYCLFLCRGAEQAVPQNPDEVWVTLDQTYHSPLDPQRLHLQTDINNPQLNKIFGLFDRVILDLASFTAMQTIFPWRPLRDLLKKTPQAELITQTSRHCSPKIFRSENELKGRSISHDFNAREGLFEFPKVIQWDDQKQAQARQEASDAYLAATQKYLHTLFTKVVLERQKPFPCQAGLWDYFVMTGPKA